jgi:enhancing lycopene biosynthesis protein 2
MAKQGAEVICFAPDKNQADVINHLTGEPMAETRNVLIEAARIARGDIHPLIQADAAELDALIVPGGFGAAKNLSTFAAQGRSVRSIRILKRCRRRCMRRVNRWALSVLPRRCCQNF